MKKKFSFFSLALTLGLLNSCVQKEHLKTVTFRVDMSNVEKAENVGIRGQFTNPPWAVTIPMLDDDGDGTYELTISKMTAQSSVDFKFVNQNDQFELECGPNRSLSFEYRPEAIVYDAVFNLEEANQKTSK